MTNNWIYWKLNLLVFASNTILTYLFSFSLIIDSYFLIPVVIAQVFNSIAELVIPIGILGKEAKAQIEAHSVILHLKQENFEYNLQLY